VNPDKKELTIILLSARGQLDDAHISRLRELCAGRVDWTIIYKLAISHRVFPLVYRNLRKYCSDSVPQELLEQCKQVYMNNCTINLKMTGYLVRVLSLLKKNDIPAIPFKGPVLAVKLYGDSSLRSFGDIDVLIQRKHLPRAVELLAGIGFLPDFSLNEQQLLKLSKTDNEYPLTHKKSGICLDLQWEITGGYFLSQMTFEDLAGDCKTMEMGGVEFPVFSDEDLLFYLCVHGNQHTWMQLDHVCCVAWLIDRNSELDWDAVFLKAAKFRGLRMLAIGLLLAQDLFGIVIPEPFSRRIREDSRAVELAHQISNNLLSFTQNTASPISHRFMKYHLISMDNPLLAIRYALRLLFIPTRYDWQCYPLPARISFLHYLIRPFRLGRAMVAGFS